MAEFWICNAAPLIALSQIGRLDLIVALADRVLVPATVLAKVAAGGQGDHADWAARRCARLLAIPMTGTIGLVALAKRKGSFLQQRLCLPPCRTQAYTSHQRWCRVS